MTVTAPDRAQENRWKMLAVLSLALLVIGLDNTILNVALPSPQEELDASSSTLAGSSIISSVFPREERATAIGIWAAMASIGVGLGPLA